MLHLIDQLNVDSIPAFPDWALFVAHVVLCLWQWDVSYKFGEETLKSLCLANEMLCLVLA